MRTVLPVLMDSGKTPGSLKRERHQEAVKRYYDKAAKDMLPLSAGQPIYYQNPGNKIWEERTVINHHSNRSYVTEGKEGGTYRRNRRHLRPSVKEEDPDHHNIKNEAVSGEGENSPPTNEEMPEQPRRSTRIKEKALKRLNCNY